VDARPVAMASPSAGAPLVPCQFDNAGADPSPLAVSLERRAARLHHVQTLACEAIPWMSHGSLQIQHDWRLTCRA
jgi:hypothetical protein